MKDNIAFVFISFVFMVVGRKVGWWLSKLIFYPAPAVISFINLIGWGVVVAVGMDVLIGWLHPNVVIKWIMGFALAAYVAIPNYGLLQESSIPDDKQTQAHDDFLATTGHLCGFGNRSATAILVRGQDGCLLSSLVPRL